MSNNVDSVSIDDQTLDWSIRRMISENTNSRIQMGITKTH